MYFSYFEKGWGELCFGANVYPFTMMLSEEIPQVFLVGLN